MSASETEEIVINDKVLKSIMNTVDNHIEKKYTDFKKRAMDAIEKYIVDHNLIIHGQYSIMTLLENKGLTDKDKELLPRKSAVKTYYKCYSCNGRKNIAELIKTLNELKYDRIQPQVKHLPYGIKCSISVSEYERGLPVVEITHISPYEYTRLKRTSIRQKTKYEKPMLLIHPLLAKIKLLDKLIDPLVDFSEWKDIYKYKVLLDKYYNEYTWFKGDNTSIRPGRRERKGRGNGKNKLLTVLSYILLYNLKNVMFIDNFVYKLYVDSLQGKSKGNFNVPDIDTYTIMAEKSDIVIAEIMDIIKNNKEIITPRGKMRPNIHKNEIKKLSIKKFSNTLDVLNPKIILRCGKKVILNVYQITSHCVPFISVKYKKDVDVNIGNYFVILRNYYAILWDSIAHGKGNMNFQSYLEGIIKNIIMCREMYLKTNNYSGIKEPNIFKVFNLKCLYINDYYTDVRSHYVRLWEYRKTHTAAEYNKIKRMCEPIKD